MNQKANSELSQEAIRLRVEERRSLREIAGITGASKSSLSVWLKPYPLTDEERAERLKSANRYVAPRKDRGEESKFYREVSDRQLTRQQKAKMAEAAVPFRMVLQGFITFGPVFNGDKADWMVEVPETFRCWDCTVRLGTALEAVM